MLTQEDLNYIGRIFGLVPIESEETYSVHDGKVKMGDKVWWAGEYGPERVIVDDSQIYNIKVFPEIYSIKKPAYQEKFSVFYTGEYED